jgi:hypothetical protein
MKSIIHGQSRYKWVEPRRAGHRAGITMFELLISAMVLISVMTFITSMCVQINFVWKDVGHHRAAVNELSNQLESLTRLAPDAAKEKLKKLEPSAMCERTLDRPEISGQLIKDNLGTRIVLKIDWNRRTPGQPVQLTGWLISRNQLDTEVDQ